MRAKGFRGCWSRTHGRKRSHDARDFADCRELPELIEARELRPFGRADRTSPPRGPAAGSGSPTAPK
jgi:hypothetical protein